jgi:hypothetical protein
MIVWIFFRPGSGGDGFANLLEQSTNVVPLDGNKQWRIHRYVDSRVKFWAPDLCANGIRNNIVEKLNDEQLAIANSDNQYLIITSHDIELKTTFEKSTILDHKHIKVLLTSGNLKDARIKNLIEFNHSRNSQKLKQLNNNILSNFTVCLDTIPNNWKDMKNLIDSFGLKLSEEDFDYYKKIVSREVVYTTPGIEYYESYIDADNITKYTKIGDNKHN